MSPTDPPSPLLRRRDVLAAGGGLYALSAVGAALPGARRSSVPGPPVRAAGKAPAKAPGATAPPERLTVHDGSLLWAGRPFSALGAVIYQLQDYFVAGGKSGSSAPFASFPYDPARGELVLREAALYGLHVARVMSMGENPAWLRVWLTQPATFWSGHDAMMAAAARYGVYLIPSLVWWAEPFAQATGNTNAQIFQAGTAGHGLMTRWVREYVTRYAAHPNVLMWELGNEWNLTVVEGGGGAPFGEGVPYFATYAALQAAMRELVATIKEIDPLHPVESGWASPAGFAAPSIALQQERFVTMNQEVDVACVHIYPLQQAQPSGLAALYKNAASQMHLPAPQTTAAYVKGIWPAGTYLQAMAQAARERLHKPLIVGEFGENLVMQPQAPFLRAVLDSWARGTFPLALVWDWMAHAGDYNNVDPFRRPATADLFRSYARKHPWPPAAATPSSHKKPAAP